MKTAAESGRRLSSRRQIVDLRTVWRRHGTGLEALKNFFQATPAGDQDIVVVVATAIYLALLPIIWFW